MEELQSLSLYDIYVRFFGSSTVIAPEYILITLLIAFIVYKSKAIQTGFWTWAVPKHIYTHSSTFLDIKLFFIGKFLSIFGLLNKVVLTTFIASFLSGQFSSSLTSNIFTNPFIIAGIIFLGSDFIAYWLHRIYHDSKLLWPIHSVHHSAEVLTPATTYRQHPFAIFISTFVQSVFYGSVQGIFLGLFATEFTTAEIFGINAFYFGFLILIHNFHHSHIWINFGPFWSKMFISPAQHQIHHSIAIEHHDKNFGEMLAIWDWIFGTLYIPLEEQKLTVGIADEAGKKLPQKHTGVITVMIVPIFDMWSVVTKSWRSLKK
ncbi:sterol desaturase family protein [Amylibacter sp. SFDW26]|uniref:sterol desaturase family protein n=1 Tax=Amylibacter sp. SFDW26 TaxID=2652722 RepID=UPI00186A9ADE|nr:sterol desaturase family protein [Amylibacter sp. SFDW26]